MPLSPSAAASSLAAWNRLSCQSRSPETFIVNDTGSGVGVEVGLVTLGVAGDGVEVLVPVLHPVSASDSVKNMAKESLDFVGFMP